MPSSYSRLLFSGDVVEVGRFCVSRDDPLFRTAGSIGGSIELVFPSHAVTIEQEGHAPFIADACQIVWYQPWQQFERRPLSPVGDQCDWIAFKPSAVEPMLRDLSPCGRYRDLTDLHGPGAASSKLAVERVRFFAALGRDLCDSPLGIEEAALRFMRLALGGEGHVVARRAESQSEVSLTERARQVIACRFSERLSLGSIAREVGCSPFHLARVFRKVTGHSLHSLQNRLRLRSGLERLGDCAGDLSGLSHELGFSSHSHFSAAFRREYGVSPTALSCSSFRCVGNRRDSSPTPRTKRTK